MISARVEGVPQFKLALKALQVKVEGALKAASLAAAEPIRDEGSRLARRRSYATAAGHLADHIEIEVVKSTPTGCTTRIGPDPDHFYGRFLETGTSKMAAYPFLRPALDSKEDEALRRFGEVLRKRLT